MGGHIIHSQKNLIREHRRIRYPGDFERTVLVRGFVERVCLQHTDRDFADANFVRELCSGSDTRYWQRLSEALIGQELLDADLDVRPSRDGPDFLIIEDGRKIWVEVICPEPSGIPDAWLQPVMGQACSFPHEEMLLRWTAAIKEKAAKLLGDPNSGGVGYRAKGVVGLDDAYVIAVNGRLLRGPAFASITGISQFPFAVEAVFAVGPYAIHIDRETLKTVGSGHQHRPTIKKPNGAAVPAYTFLHDDFRPISAIWALDIDETSAIGNPKPMAVVHNPIANIPAPSGLLPAQSEYVPTPIGIDGYTLDRSPGRLVAHG